MVGLRTLLPLLAVFACCSADAAPRAAASRPAREPEILAKIMRHPLIFFVAKGEPNACGPHCSEWIAAEGNIDTEAAKRGADALMPCLRAVASSGRPDAAAASWNHARPAWLTKG
jgi:hypothetical protein